MELGPTTALAGALEGLLVVDRAGLFTYANPAAEKILGRPATEIVHSSPQVWKAEAVDGQPFPCDDLPALRVLRTGESETCAVHALERGDGTRAIVSHKATLVRDEGGAVGGAVVSLLDVTEPKSAVDRARLTELSFREFIECSPNGIAMHRQGRLIHVNPAMLRILGYESVDDVVGQSVLEFVHPDDRPAVEQRIRAIMEEHRYAPRHEERLRRRDGQFVDAEISALRIDLEGECTILAVVVDVSEHKRVRQALDRSLSLLRATLESTADGILVVDMEGRISAFNEKFLQMWRVPRGLAEQRDDDKVVASVLEQMKDPDAFLSKLRELYADPEAASSDVIELVDGRFYERYSQPQRIDGTCVGRVWSFRDVTARRAAEKERDQLVAEISTTAAVAQRQAAELRTIHASMVDGLTVCDARGVISLLNDAAVRLLGVSRAAALDRPLEEWAELLELEHPDGKRMLARELPIARALAGETVMAATLCSVRNGRKTYVLANAAPLKDDRGEIVGAVAVDRDVTELIEFDLLKNQFVRVAAHELKTPVAIMKGYAQLLLRSSHKLPDALAGSIGAIERGANRIDRIVNDLLDLSQLQLGKMDLRSEKIDLPELVEAVTRRVALTTQKHRIRVVRTEPIVIRGDRARLEQVLGNLLDNAVRYSPRGGDIEVSVVERDANAVVSVRDHGVGIPADEQAGVFQCFYRPHTDTPYDYGGMGVGLYISREIVERHGGAMWFESKEDSGSTFSFRLPV